VGKIEEFIAVASEALALFLWNG